MIAKIYPDGHKDLLEKKDSTHPVRYFDIRKLIPQECYRLMGVPDEKIAILMQTEKKEYQVVVGADEALAAFGLEPSATKAEIQTAYKEEIQNCKETDERIREELAMGYQDPATLRQYDDDGEPIVYGYKDEDSYRLYRQILEDELEANELMAKSCELHYKTLLAAKRETRYGDVPIISNSAHYKLAGNSIVCDVLKYIYEELIFPTGRRLEGEEPDLFALPQFRLQLRDNVLKMVTLCSGYDSQCLAAEMLFYQHEGSFRLVAWSEFDPDSKAPIDKQPAVVAHNLLFPEYKDLNRGDMTKADWSDLADADIDLLTYSTPCQSISQAGKREGIKKGSGTRSAVLWSTEKAVSQMRPKVLLQENVRARINRRNLPDFKEWCAVLERLGYVNFLAPSFPKKWGKDKRDRKTVPGVLNAKDYGVPQNRERVYMVSVRKDILGDTQYEFPRPFPLDCCIADILYEKVEEKFFLQPDSVVKFLHKNAEGDGQGIYYKVTDHKLTDAEIEEIRRTEGCKN